MPKNKQALNKQFFKPTLKKLVLLVLVVILAFAYYSYFIKSNTPKGQHDDQDPKSQELPEESHLPVLG